MAIFDPKLTSISVQMGMDQRNLWEDHMHTMHPSRYQSQAHMEYEREMFERGCKHHALAPLDRMLRTLMNNGAPFRTRDITLSRAESYERPDVRRREIGRCVGDVEFEYEPASMDEFQQTLNEVFKVYNQAMKEKQERNDNEMLRESYKEYEATRALMGL